MRNAFVPVLTVVGVQLASLLGGVIVEVLCHAGSRPAHLSGGGGCAFYPRCPAWADALRD